MQEDTWRIRDEAALEAAIGEPMEFVRAKVLGELNQTMQAFIALAPLMFVATFDAQGRIDVSPKGDPAGFVEISGPGLLLIPERPGNRLTFGFRNILRGGEEGGEVGLIFVVPGQLETLRVKGRATLHRDPAVLERMAVSGKPALLYTRVAVTECFFHCGKALVRSHMWQPDKWRQERRSIAARGMVSKTVADAATIERTEAALDRSYREELY